MPANPDARDILSFARTAMETHPRRDLTLGCRRILWAALGPRSDKRGHIARASLAIACIEKVLPVWQKHLPNDNTPVAALQVARDVLAGRISADDGNDRGGEIWTHCDNISCDLEELQSVIATGYGAARTIVTAIEDEEFDPTETDSTTTDQDVDPYDMDAAFFASVVAANGAVWSKESDDKARQEFWHWYIDEIQTRLNAE